MSRSSVRVGVAVVWALTAGCHGCSKSVAPTRVVVERIADPYDFVGARGQMKDEDRAIAVIDSVAGSLGYGSVPGDVLRTHTQEPWRKMLLFLLAAGDNKQVSAAWIVLSQDMIASTHLPNDARVRARLGQALIWDLQNAKADDDVLKKAYLAEIAWALQGIGSIGWPDGGKG